MMDTLMMLLPPVLMVLGALVVLLKAIAPMTHTEWDNKALKYLSAAVEFLGRLVAPKLPVK